VADGSKNTGSTGSNPNNQATRRKVLMTVVNAGVGMLAEEAEAAHIRKYRASPRVTSVQKQNFLTAVHAFNNMGTIPEAQSPLLQVLDPNVNIFDITFDHTKLQGPPLDLVIGGLYRLVGLVNGHWLPTFDPHFYGEPDYTQRDKVTGFAQWTDSDGTSSERIHYTFKFNGNLLAELHGR
jgi:hypothetical protein